MRLKSNRIRRRPANPAAVCLRRREYLSRFFMVRHTERSEMIRADPARSRCAFERRVHPLAALQHPSQCKRSEREHLERRCARDSRARSARKKFRRYAGLYGTMSSVGRSPLFRTILRTAYHALLCLRARIRNRFNAQWNTKSSKRLS